MHKVKQEFRLQPPPDFFIVPYLLIRPGVATEAAIFEKYDSVTDASRDKKSALQRAMQLAKSQRVLGFARARQIVRLYDDRVTSSTLIGHWTFFGMVSEVPLVPQKRGPAPWDCNAIFYSNTGETCPLPSRVKVVDLNTGLQVYPPPR